MGKEIGKREALVSSKSPGQSRRGCQKSKGGKDETRDQCTDHGRCGFFRPCRSKKYIDYRIFGRTLQSKFYIADPEQDCDRKGQGHDATRYQCYHHASRYNDCSVCHFFTCQGAFSRHAIKTTILLKDARLLIWLVPSIPEYVSPRQDNESNVLQILTNETPRA